MRCFALFLAVCGMLAIAGCEQRPTNGTADDTGGVPQTTNKPVIDDEQPGAPAQNATGEATETPPGGQPGAPSAEPTPTEPTPGPGAAPDTGPIPSPTPN